MGMNYYLINKVTYNTWAPDILGCGPEYEDLNVLCLKNGFVWNKKFYTTIDELNKEYYQFIHIGKSSAGWNFLLAIYPELNIKDLKDWITLFKKKDNQIVDENREPISIEDMIKVITKREASHFNEYATTEDFEAEQVRLTNKLTDSLLALSISSSDAPPKTYKCYDEILDVNNAVRGINGLLAHNPERNEHIIPGGKNKTYDYINSVTFS